MTRRKRPFAALDTITDAVLAHEPQREPLRVLAGAPDNPLRIGDVDIPCYVLEGEIRVLSEYGFLTSIGRSGQRSGRQRSHIDQLPDFLAAQNIFPFVQREITTSTNPLLFRRPEGGPIIRGYRAELLVEVCNVYLAAREAKTLRKTQQHIAERAEILVRALAKVGIIALVDEATGYEKIKREHDLARILERYLAKDLQRWTRTFPYEFYEQIFRLKGWGSPEGVKRPAAIGHYTNDFVYARIAPHVLEELQARNPILPQGWRKNRHHQWFTPEYGHPKLREHIASVIVLMRAASSWSHLKSLLNASLPKHNTTYAMPLDIEDE